MLVQDVAPGVLEAAQAIFDRGRLVAFHCYRKTASGQRGGMAAKLGVSRLHVREHVAAIGRHLAWQTSAIGDAASAAPVGESAGHARDLSF